MTALVPESAAGRWLFVSDVDDTLVGDSAALAQLNAALKKAGDRVILVLNSSRPCASLHGTLQSVPHLPEPHFLIGALGTEIEECATRERLEAYDRKIAPDWQRDKVAAIMAKLGFTAHDEEFQTPFKASYDIPGAMAYQQVVRELETAATRAKVIYSGGKNLDIIPENAGKGTVIAHMRQELGIPADHVVVAGDSANDLDMFTPPYKGIVVANADLELKQLEGDHIYHARSAHAAGVLEGLRYWQVLDQAS
jgi:sucrose-6F-phosphate phosphohydrolase